jgi:hypothetical protein
MRTGGRGSWKDADSTDNMNGERMSVSREEDM